jgi:hypothetical protein
MQAWRISKYDPAHRDAKGAYTRDDWTSVSDLGGTFEGEDLTPEAYQAVEDAYVAAVEAFLEAASVDSLRVNDLAEIDLEGENVQGLGLTPARPPTSLVEGGWLDREAVSIAVRLALREAIWCKLEAQGRFFIHFGYDYYLYIGSERPCAEAVAQVRELGLFAEPMPSPYTR